MAKITKIVKAKDLTLGDVGGLVLIRYPRFGNGVRPRMSMSGMIDDSGARGPWRIVEGFITSLRASSEIIDDRALCDPNDSRVYLLATVLIKIDSRELLEVDRDYDISFLAEETVK